MGKRTGLGFPVAPVHRIEASFTKTRFETEFSKHSNCVWTLLDTRPDTCKRACLFVNPNFHSDRQQRRSRGEASDACAHDRDFELPFRHGRERYLTWLIIRFNRYCYPAAGSTVTGMPTRPEVPLASS